MCDTIHVISITSNIIASIAAAGYIIPAIMYLMENRFIILF